MVRHFYGVVINFEVEHITLARLQEMLVLGLIYDLEIDG